MENQKRVIVYKMREKEANAYLQTLRQASFSHHPYTLKDYAECFLLFPKRELFYSDHGDILYEAFIKNNPKAIIKPENSLSPLDFDVAICDKKFLENLSQKILIDFFLNKTEEKERALYVLKEISQFLQIYEEEEKSSTEEKRKNPQILLLESFDA